MSNSPELLDSYRILDIKPGADLDEVERAHQTLTKTWDPNRFGKDPSRRRKAEKKLRQLNQAYQRLSAELKNGVAADPDEEDAATEAAPEPQPPGATQRHWSSAWPLRFILIPAMMLALAYLLIDSYSRFESIWHTTAGTVANYPLRRIGIRPRPPATLLTSMCR